MLLLLLPMPPPILPLSYALEVQDVRRVRPAKARYSWDENNARPSCRARSLRLGPLAVLSPVPYCMAVTTAAAAVLDVKIREDAGGRSWASDGRSLAAKLMVRPEVGAIAGAVRGALLSMCPRWR